MSNIPHEKGPESSSPALSATPEQVRELAVAHRRVVFAAFLRLVYYLILLLGGLVNYLVFWDSGLAFLFIFGIFVYAYMLFAVLYSAFAIYRLARIIRPEQGIGILFVALMFVPLIGLIVLFSLSQKATKILKLYGVKVGLMGADMSTIQGLDDTSQAINQT